MSSEGSNLIFLKVSYTVWTKFFSNKIDSQPHKTWTWSPLLSFFPLRDVSSKSKQTLWTFAILQHFQIYFNQIFQNDVS